MKIEMDQRNDLLKRREIRVVLDSESNPGFENAKKSIAEKFKIDADLIVVRAVRSQFGRNNFLVDSVIYDSVEDKNKIEPKKREKVKKEGA